MRKNNSTKPKCCLTDFFSVMNMLRGMTTFIIVHLFLIFLTPPPPPTQSWHKMRKNYSVKPKCCFTNFFPFMNMLRGMTTFIIVHLFSIFLIAPSTTPPLTPPQQRWHKMQKNDLAKCFSLRFFRYEHAETQFKCPRRNVVRTFIEVMFYCAIPGSLRCSFVTDNAIKSFNDAYILRFK